MKHILLLFVAVFLVSCASKPGENGEGTPDGGNAPEEAVVNVYSHRHYPSDEMLFEKFTEQTGIKVNVVKANADQLMKRLEQEGEKSPADVLLTVDAGRLYRAKSKGLLQPISSEIINENVPAAFRDEMWVGLTVRARLIAYAKDRVKPEELTSMQNLTDAKWNGKVLVRQSNNIYNQSLMASIIHNYGEEAAKEWAKGIVANMARDPKGNDRDQMKEIAKGTGDVAIVNSYYVGMMLNSDKPEEQEVGNQIGVFFPNQGEGEKGTHINISGAGIAKYSPNKDNAIKFIEFLTSPEAQEVFASVNYEYPVNPAVQPSALLKGWGEFRADSTDFNKLGELNTRAVELFDEAGWQ